MPERTPYGQYPLDTLSYWHLKQGDQRFHPLDPNTVEEYDPDTDEFKETNILDDRELQEIRDEHYRNAGRDAVIHDNRTRCLVELDRDPCYRHREIDDVLFDAMIPITK